MKLGELYGETDPNTFEWSDGLIALATRKFSRSTAAKIMEFGEEMPRPPTGDTTASQVSINVNLFQYVI